MIYTDYECKKIGVDLEHIVCAFGDKIECTIGDLLSYAILRQAIDDLRLGKVILVSNPNYPKKKSLQQRGKLGCI